MRAPNAERFWLAAGAVALALCAVLPFGPAAAAAAGAAEASPRPSTLSLESAAPAVVQRSSGLDLEIAVSSALRASELGVSVTLFSKAVYLSTFEQTLSGDTAGLSVMSGTTGPLPLTTLRGRQGGGLVPLRLPVSAPDLPGHTGPPPSNGTILQVSCVAGGCAGVYPLQISLVDLSEGLALDTVTTYLVLAPPAEVSGSTPLRFAWTMAIGSSPALGPSGAGAPSVADTAELRLLETVLAADPGLDLSFDVSPQFVRALALARSPGAGAALSALRSFARDPARTEIVPDTFAPLDLPGLFSSGLGSDLARQLRAGRNVLAGLLGSTGDSDVFAPSTGIGPRVLASLARSGVNAVVLPSGSVRRPSLADLPIAALSPFVVPSSGAEAAESDAGLESHLSGKGGPVLRATQLLANLAVLYFQLPYARKGVALLSPRRWRPSAAFLSTVAAGLSGDPLVTTTTDSGLFVNVPPGAVDPTGALRSRRLSPPRLHPGSLLPAATIRGGQNELAALRSFLGGRSRTTESLAEGLLESESEGLSKGRRQAYATAVAEELAKKAKLVSLAFGHAITITSLTARVPISIVSRAHEPLHVVLSASSPDLSFPGRTTFHLRLVPRTNLVPIRLSARTAGNFSLDLDLSAPSGPLLVSGRIPIRSTAISGVAIGLSIAALAVLVLWWLRSTVRRRRGRGTHRGGALAARAALLEASGTPGGPPEAASPSGL